MASKNSIFVSLIAMAVSLAGCATNMAAPRIPPAAPFGRNATLIYVPGIGGFGNSDAQWARGLRAGGYDGKIETCNWSAHRRLLSALWDHARQRAEARRIAVRICELRSKSPASVIILAAHSAGAAIVAHALEDLPPDQQVDSVVLLAPALSRKYDLTAALRHVQTRADVFCSDRDTLALTIGTSLFGTVDGVHGEAAGHGGFIRPAGAARGEYLKLRTHYFSRARQLWGDDGGHNGVQKTGVAAVLIAPLLPRSPASPATVTGNAGALVASAMRSPIARLDTP